MIGVSVAPRGFEQIKGFLASAGLRADDIYFVRSDYDANMVRAGGGVVVHVESDRRPAYAEHLTPLAIHIEVGDLVLEAADHPAEYLPRLLALLTRHAPPRADRAVAD